MQRGGARGTFPIMAHLARQNDSLETESQREARLAWERARIAEAEEDIAAGRIYSADEVFRWLKLEIAEAEAAMAREPE